METLIVYDFFVIGVFLKSVEELKAETKLPFLRLAMATACLESWFSILDRRWLLWVWVSRQVSRNGGQRRLSFIDRQGRLGRVLPLQDILIVYDLSCVALS